MCPSPLINDPITGFCTVSCPLPLISASDYTTLEITMVLPPLSHTLSSPVTKTHQIHQDVLGWLSFVLTAVLIATYLLDPQRRSYPAVLPLFFIFCTNATSFAFCLGSMVGHEDVWCNDGYPNSFGAGACTVQGIERNTTQLPQHTSLTHNTPQQRNHLGVFYIGCGVVVACDCIEFDGVGCHPEDRRVDDPMALHIPFCLAATTYLPHHRLER